MHKPEPVLEKEIHKILEDFEIQMNPQIMASKPDVLLIKNQKRICH